MKRAFLTTLAVEMIMPGKWRLTRPLIYRDNNGDVYSAPTGFITDFASVPRLPFIFELFGDTAHPAAVIHDYLYTSHETTRAKADRIFRQAAELSGVTSWQAWVMYLGVRLGGFGAYDSLYVDTQTDTDSRF